MFLRIFKHLLPRAHAWAIIIDKQLRQFFAGLAAALGDASKLFLDLIFLDLLPQETRALREWETTWALPLVEGLTEQQRRDRLAGQWAALGGQSPRYIQDTLQAAGFDVYVHEWWVPGSEPPVGVKACATPRNPSTVLFSSSAALQQTIECGEPLAACGEPTAEAGNVTSSLGYPLVNKIFESVSTLNVLCGEPLAVCGEPSAESGGSTGGAGQNPVVYTLPTDPEKWPYILYIGAATFGDLAAIPSERRNEFENLCLKVCPAEQWLGIMAAYT